MTPADKDAGTTPAGASSGILEYINRFEEQPAYEMRISSGKKATYFCKLAENDYWVYTIRKGTGKLEEPLEEARTSDKEYFYMALMVAMQFQKLVNELEEETDLNTAENNFLNNEDNFNSPDATNPSFWDED